MLKKLSLPQKLISYKSIKSTIYCASFLLGFYFAVVTLFYGPNMAMAQFIAYWYFLFILALSFGFHLGKEFNPLL
jgi:hypothetical protein